MKNSITSCTESIIFRRRSQKIIYIQIFFASSDGCHTCLRCSLLPGSDFPGQLFSKSYVTWNIESINNWKNLCKWESKERTCHIQVVWPGGGITSAIFCIPAMWLGGFSKCYEWENSREISSQPFLSSRQIIAILLSSNLSFQFQG